MAAAAENPLFLKVFPEHSDMYEKILQRSQQFAEFTRNEERTEGINSIDGKYVDILLEINELGCITTNSQSGLCTEEVNPVYGGGKKKGEPMYSAKGVRMTLYKEEQRAYLEGALPKILFNIFVKRIEDKYSEEFEIVKLGEDSNFPLTQFKYEYKDGSKEFEIYSVSPGYPNIKSEYKHFNFILSSPDAISYGGGVKGLQIDESWMIFEIHSMDFCKDALDPDGLFTVVRDVLKGSLEEIAGGASGAAAAGGGGATSGGRRKSRRQKSKQKKKSRRNKF